MDFMDRVGLVFGVVCLAFSIFFTVVLWASGGFWLAGIMMNTALMCCGAAAVITALVSMATSQPNRIDYSSLPTPPEL